MEQFWIQNNVGFLARYWHTASEALDQVIADPQTYTEFRKNDTGDRYVESVVASHREHHNYSGVLLAYAVFDEFMGVLVSGLGRALDAPIEPNDLRDRGVRRYKKFVHRVCRVPEEGAGIDWDFLEDFAVVRNAIIHANGNKSRLAKAAELEAVVRRHAPALSFKHTVRLVVTDDFVLKCMKAVRSTALLVHEMARPDSQESDENKAPTAEHA